MAQRRSRSGANQNRTDGPALAVHTAWLAKATLALMETAGPLLEDDEAKAIAEHVRAMAESAVRITQIVNEVETRLAAAGEEADTAKVHAAVVHARNVADQVKMFSGTLQRKASKERPHEEETQ